MPFLTSPQVPGELLFMASATKLSNTSCCPACSRTSITGGFGESLLFNYGMTPVLSPVPCPSWPPLASLQQRGQEVFHSLLATQMISGCSQFTFLLVQTLHCSTTLNTCEERVKAPSLHRRSGNNKYHPTNIFAEVHVVALISVFSPSYVVRIFF